MEDYKYSGVDLKTIETQRDPINRCDSRTVQADTSAWRLGFVNISWEFPSLTHAAGQLRQLWYNLGTLIKQLQNIFSNLMCVLVQALCFRCPVCEAKIKVRDRI